MIKKDLKEKLPITEDNINPITNKGGEIRVLISPKTVQAKQLILGTARLNPGEVLIEHIHDYGEETFFVKSGHGVVMIDHHEIKIGPSSAIIIPQGSRHKVMNTGHTLLELVFATAPLAPTASQGDRVTNERS